MNSGYFAKTMQEYNILYQKTSSEAVVSHRTVDSKTKGIATTKEKQVLDQSMSAPQDSQDQSHLITNDD